MLSEYGYDPLPVYTDLAEGPLGSPELLKEFPADGDKVYDKSLRVCEVQKAPSSE